MKADLQCLFYLLKKRVLSSRFLARLSTPLAVSLGVHLLLVLAFSSVVVARRSNLGTNHRIEIVSFPALIEDARAAQTSTPTLAEPLLAKEPAQASATASPAKTSLSATPAMPAGSFVPPPDPSLFYTSYLKGQQDGQFTFFGLAPRGQKIVFVIDISGSMLQKTGPHTRLSLAMHEIKKAVGRLEASQLFNVVLFAETIAFYKPQPILATQENKLGCFRFLDSDPDCGGSTNLEDGLVKALGMKPDVILLLTDGEANTSSRVILSQARYLREKFNRRMQIHSIGYFLESGSTPETMLKSLSEENNGIYRRWNPS